MKIKILVFQILLCMIPIIILGMSAWHMFTIRTEYPNGLIFLPITIFVIFLLVCSVSMDIIDNINKERKNKNVDKL